MHKNTSTHITWKPNHCVDIGHTFTYNNVMSCVLAGKCRGDMESVSQYMSILNSGMVANALIENILRGGRVNSGHTKNS